MRQDTIAAIATAPGEGGIGIVRMSGPESAMIGARIFSGKLQDHRAVFGHVRDPRTGETIDEVLGLLLLAPKTYTREDTVELQGHGGPASLRQIVDLCLREGARMAQPGEFTLRAFLNGRLDLAQAESVLDIIRSKTDTSLRLAVQGLGGRLSSRLQTIRASLLDLLAYLNARIDFPDEDVPADTILPALTKIRAEVRELLETAEYGMVYRQGVRVAIIGRPNVGKSSLLNRLLREDRAIVTEIAGTTSDKLEEVANLAGIPVILTDTAGLGETLDPVERIGVQRSREAIARSDALLVVLDAGRSLRADEIALLSETAEMPRIVVSNKSDLLSQPPIPLDGVASLQVSALTGEGLPQLEQRLGALITGGRAVAGDAAVVTNPRHKAALERALANLEQAHASARLAMPEDFVSIDLRLAVEALGEITGESVTEDLLDSIFRNFCIGK